jgi:hypothetical protein
MPSLHKIGTLKDWGFGATLAPGEARRQLRLSLGLGLALTLAAVTVLAGDWRAPPLEARGGVLVLDWPSGSELPVKPGVYGG